MKSWNNVSQMLGELALADFERDPRSSDSLSGSRNFVCFWSGKQRTISAISRRTNFKTFEHNN